MQGQVGGPNSALAACLCERRAASLLPPSAPPAWRRGAFASPTVMVGLPLPDVMLTNIVCGCVFLNINVLESQSML